MNPEVSNPTVPPIENIPDALKALPQWVVRKGKIPIDPRTGEGAKAGVPSTWSDFQTALQALRSNPGRYSGLGFELNNNGIVGIDLDHVIDPESGEVSPAALKIVEAMNSYTEISPSGTGLHIFVYGNLPGDRCKHTASGTEMYQAKRYLTVTGRSFGPLRSIRKRGREVGELYRELFQNKPPEAPQREAKAVPLLVGDYLKRGLEKDKRFLSLWNGERPHGDESADDQALLNKLAYWCNCNAEQMIEAFLSSPYAQQKDERHWKKSAERKDYLQRTTAKAMQDCRRTAAQDDEAYQERRRRKAVEDFAPVAGGPAAVIQSPEQLKKYSTDDLGAARLFADVYRERALYVQEHKAYSVYDGRVWKPGTKDDLPARRLAKKLAEFVCDMIPPPPKSEDGSAVVDEWAAYRKHYFKYRSLKYRETQLKDAHDLIYTSASQFDRQPYLFNCQNGTLDLRTVTLCPHQAGDLLSKMANVRFEPGAQCERWEQFIDEVTEGNKDRARMLQKALGYALQGEANEECYFTVIGEKTRNGKGTTFDTVLNILGGYGTQIDFNTIARSGARDGSRPTPDIARLVGVRMALANEPPQGVCLNEALLKQLTGNDDIVGRPMYGDIIQFKPVFKLFVTANSKPAVADDSLFASGRVKLLPFTRFFREEERDTKLKALFRTEEAKSGILNWLLEGYRMYLAEGLRDTDEMKQLTEEYRKDNDYIQQYLEENVNLQAKGTITLKHLRMDYARWCDDMGAKPLGVKLFKEELKKHGVTVRGIINHSLGIDGAFRYSTGLPDGENEGVF